MRIFQGHKKDKNIPEIKIGICEEQLQHIFIFLPHSVGEEQKGGRKKWGKKLKIKY